MAALRRRVTRLLLAPLVASLGACGITMNLPTEFLELDAGSDYQAITPDDARVWVREFRDHDEGSVEFWAATLEEDLLRNRGYALVDKGEAKDSAEREGRWLQCAATVQGERHGYLVAVFVVSGWLGDHYVRVCEFAAREEVFARHLAAVKDALGTIGP